MFNIVKVDLKTTQLKPFVYPPDATAEYTIVDESANSKWRYPKEVADAVAGGCFIGYTVGYEEGGNSFKQESIKAWFSAYALIRIGKADSLLETIRRNLSEAGLDAEINLLESGLKEGLKEKNNNQEGK